MAFVEGKAELLLLQFAVEEAGQAVVEVQTGVATVDAVVTVGVELHLEGLIQLYQLLGIFGAVLEVDVVVGHAMHEQEAAMQLLSAAEGGGEAVVLAILLGRAHEAFAVDGVVVAPVGDGSHGHTGAEHGTPFAHAHQRHVATEAPAPDADALLIHVALLTEPECRLHLVACFEIAQLEVGTLRELCSPASCAASIHTDHDVASGGHVGLPRDAKLVEHLLRTGAAVLEHQHGVLAVGIKVAGLHHPAVELHALAGGEAEELLLRHGILGELGLECGVIEQGGQFAAVAVIEGDDRGGGEVLEAVDVVLHVTAEDGAVGAPLAAELRLAPLAVHLVDGLAHGTLLVAGEVEAAVGLTVAQEVDDLVASAGDGFLLGACQRAPVEVAVACAFAQVAEVVIVELNLIECVLADVGVALIAQQLLADGAPGISQEDVEQVLVTVEGDDGQLVGVAGEEDAGNVAVGIQGHLHLARHLALDVKGVHRHGGVDLARLGVLVGVFARVFGQGIMARSRSGKEGEAVHWHPALVPADEGQHLAVGAELQGAVHGELLLIDPVGDAVEHLVALAVLRHLALAVAVEQLDEEDVVVAHEGHHRAVG